MPKTMPTSKHTPQIWYAPPRTDDWMEQVKACSASPDSGCSTGPANAATPERPARSPMDLRRRRFCT